MSVTLATIADALIEFILSLLRDPEAAAEFDADPEAALASRGLNHVSAADVCAVAPIVAEREHVAAAAPQVIVARTAAPNHVDPPDPVVREIKSITNSLTYVDNHNTIVDQSVNQNIWAGGDVTQVFDQEAVVASGVDSVAAGNDATVEHNLDQSTAITAGDDVLVDSDKTVTDTANSNNETTETTTTTDASTDTTVNDSFDDSSTTETTDDSYNDTAVDYTEQTVDNDTDAVFGSSDTVIDDTPADDNF